MNKKKSTKKAKSNKNKDLKEELQEAKDKYLRLYSEFENYRRRTSKEKIEMIDSANKDLLKEILPISLTCKLLYIKLWMILTLSGT